ncbi:amino acid transporter [Conidiobolus coronatus NRRL 28638]|uniref:Amino acid transporter n=1 Tax=Conidiobolus coronatus (strain ATCC 28846 / CBS 209.66 / NRRL 28638) TaxID=796925 RepID=A0A137NWY0_CONC2|nr:amino acid transporter [Conidiobolus coronatus NRRL 28638]|eukprot:KXN67252.1 amino acid transporter [Conidiobolus coronatus NRRL 28638]
MVNTIDIEQMLVDIKQEKLKRNLTLWHLIALGIGSVIGTGIFVLPGIIAANNAGPGVVLSFILAAVASFFSALSYAELASMIPVAGSSYTYLYATMGEFVAWTIAWVLVLEFLIGAAAVSVGWSGYFIQLIGLIAKNPELKSAWANAPIMWSEVDQKFLTTGGYFNFPAAIIVLLCTLILIKGTKESTTVTAIGVVLKIAVILIIIFGTVDHVNPANWKPFIPSNPDGAYAHFGGAGIMKGASIAFFAYTGFESIANASQECINPQKNIPISLIATLGICTILYVGVCLVMVGVVPYQDLDVSYPVSVTIRATGRTWLEVIVILGAVFGMITAIIASLISQSRIFYTMALDGLLPKIFAKLHPSFSTPYINLIILGIFLFIASGVLPIDILAELSSLATLITFFLVNIVVSILRYKKPNLERGFKVPLGGYFLSILGAAISLALVITSSPQTILRVFIWMCIGTVLYLLYGLQNSKLNNPEKYTIEELAQMSHSLESNQY